MLTQRTIRAELDGIADEILQLPGIYAELYDRLYAARIRAWQGRVPRSDAQLIEAVAANDLDFDLNAADRRYVPDAKPTPTVSADSVRPAHRGNSEPLFNPAWDVEY